MLRDSVLSRIYPHSQSGHTAQTASQPPKPVETEPAENQPRQPWFYGKLAGLLRKPIVLLPLASGLCLTGGLAILTLSYSFFIPESLKQQPPAEESVEMLSTVDELPPPPNVEAMSTRDVVRMIDTVEEDLGKDPSTVAERHSNIAATPGKNPLTDAFSLLGALAPPPFRPVPVSSGRHDPFAPLVSDIVPGASSDAPALPPQKKDILADVQFTGFIDDVNDKGKVAILHIDDDGNGKTTTAVKKMGEYFVVDGTRITLKSISRDRLTVLIGGKSRTLYLTPYVETVASSTDASASTGTGATSSSGAPSESGGATRPSSSSILKLAEPD